MLSKHSLKAPHSLGLIAFIFLLTSSLVRADGVELIKDINTTPKSTDFISPCQLGSIGVGLAFHPAFGYEIWSSDGSPAGTHLIKDFNPGTEDGNTPYDYTCITFKNNVYFTATNGNHSILWKTDGTTAGTIKVAEPFSFAADKPPAIAHGKLYSINDIDPQSLFEITENALVELTDISNQKVSAVGRVFEVGVNDLFRAITNDNHVTGLWKILPGNHLQFIKETGQNPSNIRKYPSIYPVGTSNLGVFMGDDATHGQELWVTDGTSQGTNLLYDSAPGTDDAVIPSLVSYHSQVLFSNGPNYSNRELWTTDGTTAGTHLLKGFSAVSGLGLTGYGDSGLTVFKDRVYFTAASEIQNFELWSTDGTTAGTSKFKDIYPDTRGNHGSSPANFFVVQDKMYFSAHDPNGTDANYSDYLFVTDGTPAGTIALDHTRGDLGAWIYSYHKPSALGSKLFLNNPGYAGHDTQNFVTDGTVAGTHISPLVISPTTLGSEPEFLQQRNDNSFLFTTNYAPDGATLWRSDGTSAGTQPISKLAVSQYGDSNISGGTTYNNISIFAYDDRIHGLQLWRTDGTPAGTKIVSESVPGLEDLRFNMDMTVLNSKVVALFETADSDIGKILVVTDGTNDGTSIIKELGGRRYYGSRFVEFNGKLYFSTGNALWSTDGTTAGTTQILGSDTLSYVSDISVSNNNLYFMNTVLSDVNYTELWISDGTTAGSHKVKDLHYGTTSAVTPFGGKNIFIALTSKDAISLFTTDGTASGTQPFSDFLHSNDGYGGTGIAGLFALPNGLFFILDEYKAIVTDGTAAGTHELTMRVRSFNTGYTGSRVYFHCYAGENYQQAICSSDGSMQGSTVEYVAPEFKGIPSRFAVAGSNLILTPNSLTFGSELFKLPTIDVCQSDPHKSSPGICGCGIADTDSDFDLTPDCNDLCPNDSGKSAPGGCGCATPDTDGDGDSTPDCNDLCPSDSTKIIPGACGCNVPDTDANGNSVPDCLDPKITTLSITSPTVTFGKNFATVVMQNVPNVTYVVSYTTQLPGKKSKKPLKKTVLRTRGNRAVIRKLTAGSTLKVSYHLELPGTKVLSSRESPIRSVKVKFTKNR